MQIPHSSILEFDKVCHSLLSESTCAFESSLIEIARPVSLVTKCSFVTCKI